MPCVASALRVHRERERESRKDLGAESDDLGNDAFLNLQDIESHRTVSRVARGEHINSRRRLPVGACGDAAQIAERLGAKTGVHPELQDGLAAQGNLRLRWHA